ncbi:LexA family protein [Microbulbifer thermotolerans]|uniref:Helix-turn-helix domain-containing protein n=1 Tax=Microbulbifer thermotolerans TaxID=252514 RepID=A0AB35I1F8_MICTH|nr:LexA family transcriptional regulator [Microbulbifer thermotolerans]MCX2780401.1 helix-turn-helix domain-containing protein [Microbulbifer thermotolerans]MCX2802235.1 helix-turn-helix domain-containing protein [Microbulbifer thermotolerans]MCX2805927.1 helix-turn-helix domain-containing protein [Microbulbifer thermotolerans]
MKTTVGDRLRYARKAAKMTQQQLADRIGITKSAVSQVELGMSKGLSHTSLVRACRVLNLSPEWLSEGIGEMHASQQNNNNVSPGPEIRRSVPLISWVQAGEWSEVIDMHQPGLADEWRETTANVGPRAFALRVQGDSMTSPSGLSIPEGSVVIVDPDAVYNNGSIVVAKLEDTQEATLKRLVIDGPNKYLKPLNPAYSVIPINGNCRIIGVAKKLELDL